VPVELDPPIDPAGKKVRLASEEVLTVSFAVVEEPVTFAVTVMDLVALTAAGVKVKLSEVAPAGMVTVEGPPQPAGEPVRVTFSPPAGAPPLSETSAVDGLPPTTVLGFNVSETTFGASTVSLPDALLAPNEALIVSLALAATGSVVTVNVAELEPLGTVIDDGTAADEADEARVTLAPPWPALAESVTVPVELPPPVTEAGDTATFVTFWP
jgi:hypothetical protein